MKFVHKERIIASLKRTPIWIWLIIISIILLMLLKWLAPTQTLPQDTERAWPVAALKLEPRTQHPNLNLFGQVQAYSLTTLKAQENSKVDKVLVKPGEFVHAKQTLIQLDTRIAHARMQRTRALLEAEKAKLEKINARHQHDMQVLKHEKDLVAIAKREVARQKNLQKKRHVSELSVDTALKSLHQAQMTVSERKLKIKQYPLERQDQLAQLDKALADFHDAQTQAEHLQITAPFAGRITQVWVATGAQVNPGTSLVELFANHDLEIITQIPEQATEHLLQNTDELQQLKATTTFAGKTYELNLLRLKAKRQEGETGETAFFRFTQTIPKWLSLGKTLHVNLQLPAIKHAIAIPSSALYPNNMIYQIVNKRLVAVKIKRVGLLSQHNTKKIIVTSDKLPNHPLILITHLPNAETDLLVTPTVVQNS